MIFYLLLMIKTHQDREREREKEKERVCLERCAMVLQTHCQYYY